MADEQKFHVDLERFAIDFGNQLRYWTAQVVAQGFTEFNPTQLKIVVAAAIVARSQDIDEIQLGDVLDYYCNLALAIYDQEVVGSTEEAQESPEPEHVKASSASHHEVGRIEFPEDFHQISSDHADVAGYSHPDDAEDWFFDE